MFRRLGHVVLIAAMLAATGGHWVFLQSIAWSTMLADNLQTCSLSAAVEKTFDGNHPCPLCKEIAKGKQSEKKTVLASQLKRMEFAAREMPVALYPPANFTLLPSVEFASASVAFPPPVPPPRNFLA